MKTRETIRCERPENLLDVFLSLAVFTAINLQSRKNFIGSSLQDLVWLIPKLLLESHKKLFIHLARLLSRRLIEENLGDIRVEDGGSAFDIL